MVVFDLMTHDPVAIHQSQSIRQALAEMERKHCHHLPVVGWDGHVVGMVAYHDCQRALRWPFYPDGLLKEEELANRIPVGKVMIPAPVAVERSTPVEEAIRLMLKENISSVLVMCEETLIGILTASDIMKAYLKLSAACEQSEALIESKR